MGTVSSFFSLFRFERELALLVRQVLARRVELALALAARLFDVVVALAGPLEDQVASQQVGVLERAKGRFGVAPRREVEEREPPSRVVHLARQADRFQLAVRTGRADRQGRNQGASDLAIDDGEGKGT